MFIGVYLNCMGHKYNGRCANHLSGGIWSIYSHNDRPLPKASNLLMEVLYLGLRMPT